MARMPRSRRRGRGSRGVRVVRVSTWLAPAPSVTTSWPAVMPTTRGRCSRSTPSTPPCIRSSSTSRSCRTSEGSLRTYRITERLSLGALHFRVSYLADILEVEAARVVTVARQRPRTVVRNVTELVDADDGTVAAHTTITMTAPAILFGYAFRQLRIAHDGLGERLPRGDRARGPRERERDRPASSDL